MSPPRTDAAWEDDDNESFSMSEHDTNLGKHKFTGRPWPCNIHRNQVTPASQICIPTHALVLEEYQHGWVKGS